MSHWFSLRRSGSVGSWDGDWEPRLGHQERYIKPTVFRQVLSSILPQVSCYFPRLTSSSTVTMLFRFIATVASAAFIAQGALAALSPDQVVTNVGFVTIVSKQANDALSPITSTSSRDDIETAAKVSRGV